MEQRHVIKRQVIELTVENRATAPAIQDKISSVYRQRILPLIDRYCTELGQPDRLYRIDSLQLDLGTLDVDDLEGEFVAKVGVVLRQALAAQIASQEEDTRQPGRSPKSQSALELFTFFLQTGSLPWWSDDARPTLLAETLQRLLDEAPDGLRRLLQDRALDEDSRRRLANQFSDEQLAQMAGLFVPAWQSFFKQDIKALKSLLEKTKTGAASQPAFLRQRIWLHILQVAGLGGQQYASPQAFYQAVLKRLATDLGMTYPDLMTEIRWVLQDARRVSGSRNFKALLAALAGLAIETPPLDSMNNSDLVWHLQWLRAASAGALAEAWAALQAVLPQLADPIQARWLAAMGGARPRPAPETAAIRLLGYLQPEQAAQIGLPAAEISRLAALFRAALKISPLELQAQLHLYESQGGPLAEAWVTLQTLAPQLPPVALAAWLEVLDAPDNRGAAQNSIRLLDGDALRHGLPPVERSRLKALFQSALEILPDFELRQWRAELTALLRDYQSHGGPLARAWAVLRMLTPKLPYVALSTWLDVVHRPSREIAAQHIIDLLAGDEARHGLLVTDRITLQTFFHRGLEVDATALDSDDRAPGNIGEQADFAVPTPTDAGDAVPATLADVTEELAVLLQRYQSQGGPLAEAWKMLWRLSPRLPFGAQSAWRDALVAAPDDASAAESAIRLLNAGAAQHGLRSNERASLLQILRAATGPQPSTPLIPPILNPKNGGTQGGHRPLPDMRFSQADEIAVANAGLVILWPFLTSFFTHLGLVEDKQFKDPPAQQRSVGLLQVLAAQEPAPPEYLLPLNKLLCGIQPNQVFDFGPPLRKKEARECEKLLKAIIAQAPILRSISVDGFRGSFLLRRGQLSVRDGLWLLRVERQTYDVILERFPWGWQWIKLPWMETPIQVEWQFT